jgi:hypothetical protein
LTSRLSADGEFGFQSTYLREMRAISYLQFEIRKAPLSLGLLNAGHGVYGCT